MLSALHKGLIWNILETVHGPSRIKLSPAYSMIHICRGKGFSLISQILHYALVLRSHKYYIFLNMLKFVFICIMCIVNERQSINIYIYIYIKLLPFVFADACRAVLCCAKPKGSIFLSINPYPTKIRWFFFVKFHPLDVVARYRDSQPQVVENYSYVFNLRPNI